MSGPSRRLVLAETIRLSVGCRLISNLLFWLRSLAKIIDRRGFQTEQELIFLSTYYVISSIDMGHQLAACGGQTFIIFFP